MTSIDTEVLSILNEKVEFADIDAEVSKYQTFATSVMNAQGDKVRRAYQICKAALNAGFIDKWSGFVAAVREQLQDQVMKAFMKIHSRINDASAQQYDMVAYVAIIGPGTMLQIVKHANDKDIRSMVTVKLIADQFDDSFGTLKITTDLAKEGIAENEKRSFELTAFQIDSEELQNILLEQFNDTL